jgi:hypothetical protein
MALRTLIELINSFSISILGVDRSIVHDQQKLIDRSNRSRSAIDRGKYEGRVKSAIRGAPSGQIYKLGVTNGPENMTKWVVQENVHKIQKLLYRPY